MGHLCLIMGGAIMAEWVGHLWLIMGGAFRVWLWLGSILLGFMTLTMPTR